ncbi:MAG: HAMP domain-containing protein, partial [Streptosporangiales bacterium]|nr:HAMP domain-containing protein [Streptosporangiales bacterium]
MATATQNRQQPQMQQLLAGLTAVRNGDFSTRLPDAADPLMNEIAAVFNGMNEQLAVFTSEVSRVSWEVGTEGRLGGQARVPDAAGSWRDLTDSVNAMAGNLTGQVRNIAQVTTAVAKGDLSQKITVNARGEILELKNTINTMVEQLSAFADEVTRMARDVGTEGRLGGQAHVPGVGGTWRDLTDSVNFMAGNLTAQVRNIAQVATAVAEGDLSQKITVEARGEILELKETINTMVDQLSAFAGEVTRVARDVGTNGILGGQATVPNVAGTWKRLTENVNELAGNLTRQVRAISEVTSAVATGDLTRSISVEAQGEVAELKDSINTMVSNLRETTEANEQQRWLQTSLATIAGLMQGQRDLAVVAELIMDELIPLVGAQHGAIFLAEEDGDQPVLRMIAGYGLPVTDARGAPRQFLLGETLIGQVAKTRRPIVLEDVPADYARVSSALGESRPVNVMIVPIVFEDRVLGVIEAGSLWPFTPVNRDFLEQVVETIGIGVNTMIANARTDALLGQSQRLTAELQAGQEELQRSNEELADKAALLAAQNRDIETKNAEIERARQEIEERARQLDQASQYKSQFLANMSHELRTPLNSLLVLARLLADNDEGNLTPKQVEYATIVHSSGTDLLRLINDILDLTKVEAGKMDIHPERFTLPALTEELRGVFGPLTEEKDLAFTISMAPEVPEEVETDMQRLRQILYNLLSNAVKFTESGHVQLHIDTTSPQRNGDGQTLLFSVTDTGIGISRENLATIFSAFQQADGTTSRRYGGTGLGLAFCREMAIRLGGEVTVRSEPGVGSTFCLHLPLSAQAPGSAEGLPPRAALPAEEAPVSRPLPARSASGPEYQAAGSYTAGAHPGRGHSAGSHEELRGHTVLVVGDDPRNAFVLTDVLQMHGIK